MINLASPKEVFKHLEELVERLQNERDYYKGKYNEALNEIYKDKLCDRGSNPKNCTINGKDIPHSYGESVKVWAMAITEENRKVLEYNGLSTLLCFDFGRGDKQTAKIFEDLYVSQEILNDICSDSTGESEADFLGKNPEWITFPECFGVGSIPCEISTVDHEGKQLLGWNGRLLIIGLI